MKKKLHFSINIHDNLLSQINNIKPKNISLDNFLSKSKIEKRLYGFGTWSTNDDLYLVYETDEEILEQKPKVLTNEEKEISYDKFIEDIKNAHGIIVKEIK